MKTKTHSLLSTLGALAGAIALLATPARAVSVAHITLDTSSLIGHPAGPFYLDFQLNDGSGFGDGNNTAFVSAIDFGGGSAVAGTENAFGGVSGSLLSGLSLTDTSAFNECFQQFVPGASLTFDVHLTTNVSGLVPDLFAFTILDADMYNIPTTSLGSDPLLSITLDGASPTIATFSGTSIAIPAPHVPDHASTGLLVVAAFAGLVACGRRARTGAPRAAA